MNSWKGSAMTEYRYPPEMLRGIREKEWVNENPPYCSAFLFDEEEGRPPRKDGCREMSVTWFHDKSSLDMIRSIVYGGSSIFHGGLALVRREAVDTISSEHPGSLSYESRPTRRNPHHGNILIHSDWKIDQRMIAAKIARSAVFYAIDDDIPCSNTPLTTSPRGLSSPVSPRHIGRRLVQEPLEERDGHTAR